jgi:RNA polymerase sigma factor (sigma-70 family)
MASTALGTVLQDLRGSLLHQEAGFTDGDLLECFVTRRDEAAFAALVRRHGPMVLGVCRRVLRNEADAEDAFQATFLVLVRKAASIRPAGRVGNWLYGVAHSTALKARASRTRRLAKERTAAARPTQEDPAPTWEQLSALLDRELTTLPDRYRSAIVLCDLEGKTIQEAARQLGCPQGTVGTRLARGRRLLGRRLARHGLTLSGGVLPTALGQNAGAVEVPPRLLSSTIHAARSSAAGPAAVTNALSAEVAALTEGVLKTMTLTKLGIAAGILLTVLVAAAGGAVWTFAPPADEPLACSKAERPDPKPDRPKEQPAGPREKLTTAEKKALAELTKAYALRDEEDLKCVKPPYPESRKGLWHIFLKGWDRDEPPSNAVFRWNKGELKHWSSILGAPGPTLANLLPTLAPLQSEEIEGDKELLQERFEADFIVRPGVPAERTVASLEKVLQKEFELPVKLTFREVERTVYVASGRYRFVPVKGRADKRIELYGKDLVDPKYGNHGSGDFTGILRGAGSFIGKRIVAGRIEDAPAAQLRWHGNVLAAFTEKQRQEAHDAEAVLGHLTEQTGLSFKEEKRSVRVLFVERKE